MPLHGLAERTIPGLHAVVFEMLARLRPPPAHVLDLGAGTGAWVNRLRAAGYKVTAFERPNGGYSGSVPLVEGDLNRDFAAEFGETRFDLLTCIEVIEHVENPRHLLRNAQRLLSRDGLILITTPNIQSTAGRLRFLWTGEFRHFGRDPTFNEPTHITPIHTLMLERALDEVGLRVIEHRYDRAMTSGSRWMFALLARVLDPLLRGPRGGNNHIYVLAKDGRSSPGVSKG
jgi:2-polyprenyl-3-methyl-5-hydroxy-6-metoxy-1,4-benzoquinol methylase